MKQATIELYSYHRSSAAFRVRIALNLKGLKYDITPVNLLTGEQRTDDYLKINPLGLVPAEAMDYGRVYALASNPIGRLVILLTAVLPLWKGAHHLRHLSVDHGGEGRDTLVAPILYGIATLGSIVGIVGVIRL